MEKVKIHYTERLARTIELLSDPGLLLVAQSGGKPNAMAIGWGTVGIMWTRPVFMVMVRPSRYTYGLINSSGEFTVNVPRPDMAEIVSFCGTVSGRDVDKFAEKKLTAVRGLAVKTPVISECPVNYECRVIGRLDLLPESLDREFLSHYYPKGDDLHRIYFGEILAVQTEK